MLYLQLSGLFCFKPIFFICLLSLTRKSFYILFLPIVVLKINEVSIDLYNSASTFIEIAGQPETVVNLQGADTAIIKQILFINPPAEVKGYNNISNDKLFKIRKKFRVNYEQAVVYKLIEYINFYKFIIVFTDGFDFRGIEYLTEIKRLFEFADRRIFVIKRMNEKPDFHIPV